MTQASPKVIAFAERRARKLIEDGLEKFSEGDIQTATKLFQESLTAYETAEGYTYWGWMLSFAGQLDAAIELCKKAIEIDPDIGNPYNDIGTYYMKMGALDDAIPWLERAKQADRYDSRHFPFLNLGRIYLSRGMFKRALVEFEQALPHDPQNDELRTVIERIRSRPAEPMV